MIGRLRGVIIEKKHPNFLLLEVGGVGYEVELPVTNFAMLPSVGKEVVLLIHHVVREDASLLYGFTTRKERDAFRILIKISGIGPKSAIGILSGLSAADLYRVIQAEDIGSLTKVPGIGKKTAERLILELRDKIQILAPSPEEMSSEEQAELPTLVDGMQPEEDAVAALMTLGYSQTAAKKMVSKIYEPTLSVDELIRRALQNLMQR